MDEISNLLQSMKGLLGGDMHLAGGIVSDSMPQIHDEEWQQVATASPKRQREYSCGRYYGHRLLEQMGFADFIINRDDKGCPLWPEGVAGSISHTSHYCVAMLAKTQNLISLGIDLEESGRMKASLWPRLFSRAEIGWLEKIDELAEQMRQAAIIFSAKEAFYKCDYPLNGRHYEFTDVEIMLDETRHHLQLNLAVDGRQITCQGRYVSGVTHVMTVVYQNRQ